MVIKGLLGHADLLGMRMTNYLLIIYVVFLLARYTMIEKGGIITYAYDNNFGNSYETYKIAAKQSPNIRLQGVNDIQVKFEYEHIVLFPVSLYLNLRLI